MTTGWGRVQLRPMDKTFYGQILTEWQRLRDLAGKQKHGLNVQHMWESPRSPRREFIAVSLGAMVALPCIWVDDRVAH